MPGRDIAAPPRPNPLVSVSRADVALVVPNVRNEINARSQIVIRPPRGRWSRPATRPRLGVLQAGGGGCHRRGGGLVPTDRTPAFNHHTLRRSGVVFPDAGGGNQFISSFLAAASPLPPSSAPRA